MKKSLKSPRRFISVTVMLFMFFCIPPVISADTDVTEKTETVKSRLAYHRREQVSFLDVSLKNISQEALRTPLKAVVENITDPSVTVANADGVTGDGKPYFEYSADPGSLSPGSSTAAKTWKFSDPLRKRFDYTVRVLSSGSSSGISITSPAAGTVISRPDIMVRGTLTDPGNETGVVVNGIPAAVYGNEFAANHVPLEEGQNTVTAAATGADGKTAETSLTVSTVTAGNHIRLLAVREAGIPPLETELRLDGSFSFEDSLLACTGPSSAEITKISGQKYNVRINSAGIYYFTAQVNGSQNGTYTDTVAVTVTDEDMILSLLSDIFNQMTAAMKSGNIEAALGYFTPAGRERYGEKFGNTGSEGITAVFSGIIGIHLESLYEEIAKCGIIREENGENYSYPVTFAKDGKGLWKIAEL